MQDRFEGSEIQLTWRRQQFVASRAVWVHPAPRAGLDYVGHLCRSIERAGWTVRVFTWSGILRSRPPAIIHIHWPENLVKSQTRLREIGKFVILVTQIHLCRAAGTKVVFTGHNLVPHEEDRVGLRALNVYRKMADGAIHLSSTGHVLIAAAIGTDHPKRFVSLQLGDPTEGVTIPDRRAARSSLNMGNDSFVMAALGRARSHKRRDHIVKTFCVARRDNWRLLIQGDTACTCDTVVKLPSMLTDESLVEYLVASDLAVFDFSSVLHSGSVALALGLGVPTIAPRCGAIEDLAREFSFDYVRLFDGVLTPEVLAEAVVWSQSLETRSPRRTPAAMQWEEIGQRTVSFYESLCESGEQWGG